MNQAGFSQRNSVLQMLNRYLRKSCYKQKPFSTQDSQDLRWKERSPGNIGGDLAFPNSVVLLPKAYHSGGFANTATYTTELKDPDTLIALNRLKLYVESK